MLTLNDMKTQVSRMINKSDSAFLTKLEDFINQRQNDIVRRWTWPQLITQTTVTSTAGLETVIMPKDMEYIIEIHDRVNDVVLFPSDPSSQTRSDVSSIDAQAIPHIYWLLEDTVLAQPTSSSVMAISSSDATDTTQTVRVWGISSGEETTDQVNLSGTGTASTVNAYTRIDRISKSDVTAGVVTITSNGATVTVSTIAQRDFTSRHTKIRLHRVPNAAIVYNLTYYKRIPRLQFSDDVPVFPIHQALIIGAYAQALEEQRQFSKAQFEWTKYESEIFILMQQFEQKRDFVPLFQPQIMTDGLDVGKDSGNRFHARRS